MPGSARFDLPLLLRVDVPTTSTVVPFIYAGPNLGFLLSAKASSTGRPEEDIKSDVKSTDLGLAFGGGVRLGRLTAELRYVLGLTNVDKARSSDGGTIKNSVIKVIAGFRF